MDVSKRERPNAQVACGARHSCAVTDSGALLCWGWNLHGQCGTGAVADRVPQPQLVPMPLQLRCKQVRLVSGSCRPTHHSKPTSRQVRQKGSEVHVQG